ncbi:MAG: winged helix-turn-helix domain-containing protein [Steroidobacteraceae bacterium]
MSSLEQVLSFGPFELYRTRKLLLESGEAVRLGSRALELLVVLVERAGEVVGKNELMARVWPDTVVEENNLRVHITALRKRLGEGQGGTRYIVNVAGRGYTFVAPVIRSNGVASDSRNENLVSNLPAPLGRPVGRSELVASIATLFGKHRLVTLVGPGGVGKSTVALAAAQRFADSFDGTIHFVDLAAVADAPLVPSAIATVLGMSVAADDAIGALVAGFRDQPQLILLDNCEHVVGACAAIVSRLLQRTQRTLFLATSRESLLVENEQAVQIPSLELPDQFARPSLEEALRFPAIQLFVERAGTGFENFQLTEASVETVTSLCRRLDGIPLAIEIVAARAGMVGLDLLALGEDPTGVLRVAGRRTAADRHSSLQATLDWSYLHLSPDERIVLQRLSVFRGPFSLDAAVAIVGSESGASIALEAIVALAGKSLLSSDITGPEVRYRLLNLTRAYAADRLEASGDTRAVSKRHAEYLCRFMEDAVRDYVTLTRSQWLALHRSSIDDVRSALEWSFGEEGDERLGARLTVAAVTFGFQLSLIDEFKARVERALEAVRRFEPPDPELDVRLTLARTNLRIRTADKDDELGAEVARVVMLTRESGAPRDLIWPLTNRTLIPLDFGDYAAAKASFADLEAVAREQDDAFAVLAADRVGAMTFHWAGDHARARRLAERVLRHPAETIPLAYSHISVDRRVSMRVVLARILWLEGFADQARQLAAEALELAVRDSPNAVCDALGHAAVPIALWCGDRADGERWTSLLLDYTRRYTLTRWHVAALCFRAVWTLQESPGALEPEMDRAAPLPGLQRDLMATFSTRWIDATTLARGQQELGGWCSPELLRVAALQSAGSATSTGTESALERSLRAARAQGAAAWELRSAMSLARLWQSTERLEDAFQLLAPVYRKFTQGLDTRDLREAKSLLLELQR